MSLFLLMKGSRFVPVLVTSRKGKLTRLCEKEGIKYYTVPMPMWRKLKSWRRIPFSLAELVRLAAEEEVDLVYANTLWDVPYAVFVGQLLGLKKVGHIRNTFSRDKIGKYLLWWLDGVIAVSFAVSRPLWMTRLFWKVIYNGVVESTGEKSPEKSVFRIALVGRVDSTKGQDIAVEALSLASRRARDFELCVAGEESYLERGLLSRLKRRAAELGIAEKVRFLGHVDDVYSLFKSSDLSIVPSKPSSNEGFGRIIPEAFVNRTPVVATSVGGIPEVMRDKETGYLVPVDAASFSHKFLLYRFCPMLGRKHGVNGFRLAGEKFIADHTSRAIERFLERVL